MVEEDRSLPSVVQELWDRAWQHSGKLMLILAGSYVGFMEREVLGGQKPLGGRRAARILLEPFKFWEAAEFHPNLSKEDQARIYFITGGIPQYLLAFKQNKSIEENICGTLLDEFSPLSHEPEFLLREELKGLDRFQAVLDILAAGRKPLSEIAKAVAVDPRSIIYQLQTLAALGYVERVLPLTAREAPARHVRYGLGDAFLRYKQVQIDVVGLRHDNWIDLGECKWGSVPPVPQLIAEVEAKVKLYPNKDNATLGRLVFTRRRVKAPKAWTTTRFLSLEELYSMG